jgi:hypothetical protein
LVLHGHARLNIVDHGLLDVGNFGTVEEKAPNETLCTVSGGEPWFADLPVKPL